MKRIFTIAVYVCIMMGVGNAQTDPKAQVVSDPARFDEYSNLSLKDEMVRLDNIARSFPKDANVVVYFVAYAGRRSCVGEAQARAMFSKNYLIEKHGISPERIMWKDGGYREKSTIEVWFISRGSEVYPVPTIEPHEARSRNCQSKYLRQVKRGKS
jgi:hypothetical protein